jgi:hypothetical protein
LDAVDATAAAAAAAEAVRILTFDDQGNGYAHGMHTIAACAGVMGPFGAAPIAAARCALSARQYHDSQYLYGIAVVTHLHNTVLISKRGKLIPDAPQDLILDITRAVGASQQE